MLGTEGEGRGSHWNKRSIGLATFLACTKRKWSEAGRRHDAGLSLKASADGVQAAARRTAAAILDDHMVPDKSAKQIRTRGEDSKTPLL